MAALLTKKLLIREGNRVAALKAPPDFRDALGELPQGAKLITRAGKDLDVVILFADSMASLQKAVNGAAASVKADGRLWVAYPKGTSRIKTDLNRDIIWREAKEHGLNAVTLVAIDATWSAMRLKRV